MSRALVLSGGGSKGAFQVGALNYLKDIISFDIITGTSVGAINAAMVAQDKISELVKFWLAVTGNDYVMNQDNTLITALLRKLNTNLANIWSLARQGYIFDPTPLANMLESQLDPNGFKRMLRVGTVDLVSGNLKLVTEKDPNIVKYTLASASQPLYFPTVSIDGGEWVDGGLRNITPLKAAITILKTLPAPREIWVILTNPLGIVGSTATTDPLNILLRTIDILTDEIYKNDLQTCINGNALARCGSGNYQEITMKVVVPDKVYSDTLSFDPATIRIAGQAGFEAAKQPWDEQTLQQNLLRAEGSN